MKFEFQIKMLRSVDIERQLERGRILLKMTSCDTFETILVLSLRELQLSKVFRHLIQCTNIQILFLDHNRVAAQDIRSHMYKLKTLKKLDLSHNEVHDFPSEPAFFGQMKALEFLALDGNAVQVPNAIIGLRHAKQLKYLSLQDNPIQMTLQQTYRFEIASILPNLMGLDQNVVTFDELTYRMENRSIRFCSMNTFSRLSPQATAIFIPEMSALQHQIILDQQLSMIRKQRISNDPLIYIRASLKQARIAKVATSMITKYTRCSQVIQRFTRGFLTRLRMKREFLAYFDSIGEIQLTMSTDEAKRYNALKTLRHHLPGLAERWQQNKLLTRTQKFISKFVRGWRVRQHLEWVFKGPLKMSENRYLVFLKEQKYLLKHILRQQQKMIPPYFANQLVNLISDYPEYYLVRHVDLDLYDIPNLAVLQFTVPATRILVAKFKKRPQALRQGRTLFELCISPIGDQKAQRRQLSDLQKLGPTFHKLSTYEIQVGRQQIIPQDYKKSLLKQQQNKMNQKMYEAPADSLLMSSVSSETKGEVSQSSVPVASQSENMTNEKDRLMFRKILRRQGQDFVRLDLRDSESPDINSDLMMERLLKVLITWNRENEVNQIHFYVGELFKRQVAVVRIQRWMRLVMRIARHRREQNSKVNFADETRITLQPNQLTILRCLLLQRAARKIQHCWSMYRLRRRIKMLADLRDYLQGVTQSTLCIEEHLYKNVQAIQSTGGQYANDSIMMLGSNLSQPLSIKASNAKNALLELSMTEQQQIFNSNNLRQNDGNAGIRKHQINTIPEAHCFAFDFKEKLNEFPKASGELQQAKEGWRLIFKVSRKYFAAQTNQETHGKICDRFDKYCIPKWVVYGEKAIITLKQKVPIHMDTFDKNNTTSIFHKTQQRQQTAIMDYNEIVPSSQRTFVMNNGLRFVVFSCVDILDARRRALALAMITLDRKRGNFLKVFCPNQLHSGTFMPSIKCWWDHEAIQKQIPGEFYSQLTQPGQMNLRKLPLPIQTGHSGFILSAKDHEVAYEAGDRHSVQIMRQRNYDELQMKLVLPHTQNPSNLPSANETANFHFEMQFRQQSSEKASSDSLSQYTPHVHFQSIKLADLPETEMLLNDVADPTEKYTLLRVTTQSISQTRKDSIGIQVQGDASDQLSQIEIIPTVAGRNYAQSFQGKFAKDKAMKADQSFEVPVANIHDKSFQMEPETQVISLSSEREIVPSILMGTAGYINPYSQLQNNQNKTFLTSSTRVRATTGRAQRPPQQSYMQDRESATTRTGGVLMSTTTKADSLVGRLDVSSIESGQSNSIKMLSKDHWVHSGFGTRVKSILVPKAIDGIYTENEPNKVKGSGSQKIISRRPKTSFVNTQMQNIHLQQKNMPEGDKDIDKLIESVKRQKTFRIGTDVPATTAYFTHNNSGKSRSGTAMATVPCHRVQEINELQKQSSFQKLNGRNDQQSKANRISKQQLVSHLITSSIIIEKEKRLKLINKISRQQKNQIKVVVNEKERLDVQRKNFHRLQRAQSNISNRSKRLEDKDQAYRLTSAANMLNKVHVERIREDSKRRIIQTARNRVSSSSQTPYIDQGATSCEQLLTVSRKSSKHTTVTPQFFNIDTTSSGRRMRKMQESSLKSLNNKTDIMTQRLDPFSNQTSRMMPSAVTGSLDSTHANGNVGGMGLRNMIIGSKQQQLQINATIRPLNVANFGQDNERSTQSIKHGQHSDTLLMESLQGAESGIHHGGVISSYVDRDLFQQQKQRISQAVSMQDLPILSSLVGDHQNQQQAWPDIISNYQSSSSQERPPDQPTVYSNLVYNPATYYGDAATRRRVNKQDLQQFEQKALPVKLMQKLPYNAEINRDIQNDLVSGLLKLTGPSKQSTDRSQHSDCRPSIFRNNQKSQFNSQQPKYDQELQPQQQKAQGLPVTLKEYQLQMQPKSKSRPMSNRTGRHRRGGTHKQNL